MSYIKVDNRIKAISKKEKLKRFLKRTFSPDLFIGLSLTFKEMVKKNNSHTLLYPFEKMELNSRYRGVHSLQRLLESGNERCIGCGLCEKICISKCIRMETFLANDGRKKVKNYSINLGRCVYCGLCADVCPELAIVHTKEYEFASEQRAYYAFKDELLSKNIKKQEEFSGYGSYLQDDKIRLTPTDFLDKENL